MAVTVKVPYNIDTIITSLRNPSRLWNIASTLTVAAVGIFSKIFIGKGISYLLTFFNLTTTFSYLKMLDFQIVRI